MNLNEVCLRWLLDILTPLLLRPEYFSVTSHWHDWCWHGSLYRQVSTSLGICCVGLGSPLFMRKDIDDTCHVKVGKWLKLQMYKYDSPKDLNARVINVSNSSCFVDVPSMTISSRPVLIKYFAAAKQNWEDINGHRRGVTNFVSDSEQN